MSLRLVPPNNTFQPNSTFTNQRVLNRVRYQPSDIELATAFVTRNAPDLLRMLGLGK